MHTPTTHRKRSRVDDVCLSSSRRRQRELLKPRYDGVAETSRAQTVYSDITGTTADRSADLLIWKEGISESANIATS